VEPRGVKSNYFEEDLKELGWASKKQIFILF